MAEEIAFENGRISNLEELVTLTLDRVILHTVVHHLSTSTYMPNFIEIEETFRGRMDVRKYVRTDRRTFETGFIRSTLSKIGFAPRYLADCRAMRTSRRRHGAPQSALRHSRSTKFPSVQHYKLRPTSIYVRRPSCLELTSRTFATNHFTRTFQVLSKTFLFGQISRSAH